jgi:asparagine synthase (glutamine-hydrolysing)
VFLLWDERRRTLFGARDGLGQRVLFFHRTDCRVVFASTLPALLALDDVPARLNKRKVAMALVLLPDPGATYYEGIERVLPGHMVEVGPSGMHSTPFWTPIPTREIRFSSDDEYVEAFRDVFDSAVRARTRGTGGIGVLLSGGIDSTAVATTAALTMAGRPLHAFHSAPALTFDGRIGRGMVADESADVEAVVGLHPGIDLRIDRDAHLEELWEVDALYHTMGSPVRNPSNWGWYRGQYAAAQSAGVRVMLNGSMGNATISHLGTRSLRDLPGRGEWATLWRELHSVAAATGSGRWSVLRDQVLLPLTPLPLERLYRRRRGLRTLSLLEQSASPLRRDQVSSFALEDIARSMGRGADQVRRSRGLDLRRDLRCPQRPARLAWDRNPRSHCRHAGGGVLPGRSRNAVPSWG